MADRQAILQQFSGYCVAVTERPYDFADKRTGERRSGVAIRAFFTIGADEAPIEIRCSPEMARQLRADLVDPFHKSGQTHRLDLDVEVLAAGYNEFRYDLLAAKRADAKAAA